MEQRLIAGYDGSPQALAAIGWAAVEAQRRQAVVSVVACYSVPLTTDFWGSLSGATAYDDEAMRGRVEGSLRSALATTRAEHPDVKFEDEVVLGAAGHVLAERSSTADLVVVGRAGSGAAARSRLGSVADAVARTSHCPVVVVPSEHRARPGGRIVVGVDGSAAADAALDWAVDEADLRHAELTVLHAWWYSFGGAPETTVARDVTRVDAALVLEAAEERARARGGCAVRGELAETEAAQALVDSSTTAELLVVGSRGRGSFGAMLFGSVARAVTARAECPTIVVRAAPPPR